MTKFVVDASAVLHLASEGVVVGTEHELLAPTLLRSQVLSTLHEAVQRGELTDEAARARLAVVNRIKVRLLGDAVEDRADREGVRTQPRLVELVPRDRRRDRRTGRGARDRTVRRRPRHVPSRAVRSAAAGSGRRPGRTGTGRRARRCGRGRSGS